MSTHPSLIAHLNPSRIAHPTVLSYVFLAVPCVRATGIMFANKIVLTTYNFPSFATLTLFQFFTTCLMLSFAKARGWIHFPDNDIRMFGKVFPLQFLFLISTVFSLGGMSPNGQPP